MNRMQTRTWVAFLFIATVVVAFCCPGAAFAADGHVTGTVTDGIDGLAGINVVPCVHQPDNDSWEEQWGLATSTIVDGTYDLAVPPGTYRLRFVDPSATYGYQYWPNANVPYAAQDVVVGDGQTVTDKNVLMPIAARITGKVVADAGGAPLENIGVTAAAGWNGRWPGVVGARTDVNGDYTLGGLPPGSYQVHFNDDDDWAYASELYDNEPFYRGDLATVIPLDFAGLESDINASLADGASIEGTVTGSATPLGGAVVWLAADTGAGNWAFIQQRNTGVDGSYQFQGLAAATYRLQFGHPNGSWVTECYDNKPPSINEADNVTVSVGQHRIGVSADLGPAGFISGTVSGAGDGTLEGIPVTAYVPTDDGIEPVAWARTDVNGIYTLGGLGGGSYLVQFTDDAGNYLSEWYDDVRNWSEATGVAVSVGGTTPDIDAVLAPASHITGTVTDGTDPIPNIRIAVYTFEDDGQGGGWWNERGEWQAWTDAEGHYDLGGLEPGTYRIGFRDDSGTWATEFWDDKLSPMLSDDIVLAPEETRTGIDADLAPAAHITGRVTSDGTTGIANVTVTAGPFDVGMDKYQDIAWAQTDAEGYYDLSGLPAGTFRVQFWDNAGNYLSEHYDDTRNWSEATGVAVSVGGTTPDIDAVLAPASHITGTVTDGTDPIPNIRIAVYTFEDDGQGGGWWNERGEWQAWTDAEGHYDLGGLEPGTYRIGFRDDSGTWATEFWDDKLSPMLE